MRGGIDAPDIPLSNSENRRSLSYSYQKLFNLQPGLFYFETDSSFRTFHIKYRKNIRISN